MRDGNEMDRACKGGDTLIHLAAQSGVGPSVLNPRLDFEVNCLGTLNVLEAAKKQDQNFYLLLQVPAWKCQTTDIRTERA